MIKIKTLNQENMGSGKQYPDVCFAAVNCARQRKLCDSYKIQALPTVVPFNFTSLKETDRSSKIRGSEEVVTKFLKTKYFQYYDVDIFKQKQLNQQSKHAIKAVNDSPSGVVGSHYLHPLSHFVNSGERWGEAISAFYFFLLNELPSAMSSSEFHILRDFSQIVFLISKNRETLEVYSAVSAVAENSVDSSTVLSDRLKKRVLLIIQENDIRWNFCGVPFSQEKQIRGSVISSASSHSDSSSGYPCGLWLLFHGFAANEQSYDHRFHLSSSASVEPRIINTAYSPLYVLKIIFQFVSHFFNCDDCRSHFVEYYNKCVFDCCQITDSQIDYSKLRLWLFYFHNFVSLRINIEEYHTDNFLSPDVMKTVIVRYLWPTPSQCFQCYNSKFLTKSQVPQRSKVKDLLRTEGQFELNEEFLHIVNLILSNDTRFSEITNSRKKLHRKDIDQILELVAPKIFPLLFVKQEIVLFLNVSFNLQTES
jgi:hypothetical protein